MQSKSFGADEVFAPTQTFVADNSDCDEQIGESYEDSLTLKTALPWDQLQCALLAFQGDDELVWFATQEIELHLAEWK